MIKMSLISIWGFIDSNFFSAAVTLATGLVALIIYKRKQSDDKKDAASIILLELQNAERQLKRIRENMNKRILEEDNYLMQTESWSKYKYLFVRDFDRDEWDTISDYYHRCHLVDSAITHQSSFFQKNEEQLRINIQKNVAKCIEELIQEKDETRREEILKEASEFQDEIIKNSELTFYSPQKPINDVKQYLESWNADITNTAIGVKLKRLAKYK